MVWTSAMLSKLWLTVSGGRNAATSTSSAEGPSAGIRAGGGRLVDPRCQRPSEGLLGPGFRLRRVIRRHHASLQFAYDLLRHFGVLVGVGHIERLESQASRLQCVAVAEKAILTDHRTLRFGRESARRLPAGHGWRCCSGRSARSQAQTQKRSAQKRKSELLQLSARKSLIFQNNPRVASHSPRDRRARNSRQD